jgi:hypothetical protein
LLADHVRGLVSIDFFTAVERGAEAYSWVKSG